MPSTAIVPMTPPLVESDEVLQAPPPMDSLTYVKQAQLLNGISVRDLVDLSVFDDVTEPQPTKYAVAAAISHVHFALKAQADEDLDERLRTARVAAIVPAYMEQKSIGLVLDSLLFQTVPFDEIVVVVNGWSLRKRDKTADIVRAYAADFPQVTLIDAPKKHCSSKVQALNMAWQYLNSEKSPHAYQYVYGADADVVCGSEVLEALLSDMTRTPRLGALRAQYSFGFVPGMTRRQKWWLRAQQEEFASVELDDQVHGGVTQIAGGQSSLFRMSFLRDVARQSYDRVPWDATSPVEDSQLSRRARQLEWLVRVSDKAYVQVGPMLNFTTWFAQRFKWYVGHMGDIGRDINLRVDRRRWQEEVKMGWDSVTRLLLAVVLPVSALHHMFVFRDWWALPTALTMVANTVVASKMPVNRMRHIIRALLFFPAEWYLWCNLMVWITGLFSKMLNRHHGDHQALWRNQAEKENLTEDVKRSNSHPGLIAGMAISWLVVGPILLCGVLRLSLVSTLVRDGWAALTIMTVGSAAALGFRILRYLRQYTSLHLLTRPLVYYKASTGEPELIAVAEALNQASALTAATC